MASKSKRRRRVLGASCILAALIVAGSSFAWFTSQDEVTNRLSASADYGVSIVESFTPPKNLLPGQNVNKDVYAVNTGNIAAFVKENLQGVLNYTYESKVNSWDKDCVTLTLTQAAAIEGATVEDGFKTMEAGGYLAWTDTSMEAGPLYSGRTQDITTPWYPTETGTYIFRRSIGGTNENPTFEYSGYYFVRGTGTGDSADPALPTDDTYYKIVIGNDAFRFNSGTKYEFDVSAPSSALRKADGTTLATEDIDSATGEIKADNLKISYVKETEVNDANVVFEFQCKSTTDNDNDYDRLKVEYTAVNNGNETYDASALAARAEVDYENAKKFSDSADKWAAQANAEYKYVQTLVEETNKLRAKARAAKAAKEAADGAVTARTSAWEGLVKDSTGATNVLESTISTWLTAATITDGSAINPANTNFLPAHVVTAANLKTDGTNYDYPQVHQNYTELVDLYNAIFNTTDGYVKKIQDAIDAIQAINDDTSKTPAQMETAINEQLAIINTNLASLKTALAQYKLKYADLINQTASDTTITIATGTENTQKAKIQTVLDTVNGDMTTNVDDVNTKAATYIEKFEDWYNADGDFTTAQTAWIDQVNEYNTNVNAAKATYDGAVPTADNHGTTIVPAYSADTADDNGTPAIVAGADDYNTYAVADIALPATSAYKVKITLTDETGELTSIIESGVAEQSVDAWNTLKTDKNNAAAVANAAYEDAVDALTSGSTIIFYVNLAEDYDQYWQMDNRTDKTDNVAFYLKKVLEEGETSHKLVDSISFADTVTANDYKDLTFDLNVGLDSAQIVYADDQRTILTTAVDANDAFDMTAAVGADNTTVSWS